MLLRNKLLCLPVMWRHEETAAWSKLSVQITYSVLNSNTSSRRERKETACLFVSSCVNAPLLMKFLLSRCAELTVFVSIVSTSTSLLNVEFFLSVFIFSMQIAS